MPFYKLNYELKYGFLFNSTIGGSVHDVCLWLGSTGDSLALVDCELRAFFFSASQFVD